MVEPPADDPVTEAPRRSSRLPPLLAVLRPLQWAKSALVFLAPLGAHRLAEPGPLKASALAFAAFCLVASGLYVANDLLDQESDRAHPSKRHRPFASGRLAPAVAWGLIPSLLLGGVALGALLPPAFLSYLFGYALASAAYSLVLKRQPVTDVLVLAGLYTVRIYAGAAAVGVPVSEWLASFSMFLFLSLALMKRAVELARLQRAPAGRGYRPADRGAILGLGTASGYVAVLVLALYVSSADVRRLYASPAWIWALCPLVLFWVSRLWLLAGRGEMDDDPVVFALRDRSSWVAGGLAALVLWLGARG